MKRIYYKALALILIMAAGFALCPVSGANAQESKPVLRLAYTDWSSSVASANMIKAFFEEKLDIRCEIKSMPADKMWQAVAKGDADVMVSAWLPDTHFHYYEEYKNQVVDLGPNLEGTKIGLVIPDVTMGRLTAGSGIKNKPYIPISSITELSEHADKFRYRIVGIEPEAGIMHKTQQAMEIYGLTDFRLQESSEVAMLAELSHAIRHQKWIVITGWLPHWSFARWNLKFLDDPENVFGGSGSIHTIVRKGLKKDMPGVYKVLDHFFWEASEMGQLMLWIQEDDGMFPYEKALRWMRANPEKIEAWLGQK